MKEFLPRNASPLPSFHPILPQALGTDEIARLLKRKDEDGRTLLHTAAARGHTEIVELLLDAGGSCNTADDEVRVQQMRALALMFWATQCCPYARSWASFGDVTR